MSESSAERSFEPTASRLTKARREGDVPRAHEFSANAAFLGGFVGLLGVIAPIGAAAQDAIATAAGGTTPVGVALSLLALALLPFVAAGAAGSAASLLQHGGLHVIAPTLKFERLAPAAGFKRMVSRDTIGQSVRASCAFAAAALAVCGGVASLLGMHAVAATAVAATTWAHARVVVFVCAAIGLVLGLVEFVAARRSWLRRLRMTFDELRRDAKEQEGDPRTRSRRKAAHRALLRGSMARVKEASFVVVNPTHVAIALAYDPPAIAVPELLVRATDAAALRVREIAREYDIPVVENVSLARALLRDGQAGSPIPVEHYVAVAEIVASLAGRNRRVTARQ